MFLFYRSSGKRRIKLLIPAMCLPLIWACEDDIYVERMDTTGTITPAQPDSMSDDVQVDTSDNTVNSGSTSDLDSDGDRLSDARELELGTSPEDPDTDGDGFSDGEEVIDLAFDPTNDSYAFNPLSADLPKVSVALTSLPDISISYGTSVGTATTNSVNQTQGFSNEQTTTSAYSNSTTVEQKHEGGGGFSISNPLKSLQLNYSYSRTSTEEESFSWQDSQTVTNHQSYVRGVEDTVQQGYEYTGGELAVTVKLINRGNQSVEISLGNLSLAAVQTDPQDAMQFKSIANLLFDADGRIAPTITLQPGESTDEALRFSRQIDLGTALALLKDSTNLIVRLATWNFVDDQGRSFAHDATYYNAKNAMILVDYGPNSERPLLTKSVAVNGDARDTGISAEDAMRRVLDLPYEIGSVAWDYDDDGIAEGTTANSVIAIHEMRSDYLTNAYWMVLHQFNDAQKDQSERVLYDPTQEQALDLATIPLKAGHVLHFVYIEDKDDDGIAAREEFLHGLLDEVNNPDSGDTDQDGRSDYEELRESWMVNIRSTRQPERAPYTVYSSPSHDDLDRDGVADADEKARGLDPSNADTDEDGIPDGIDRRHIALSPIIDDLRIEIRNIVQIDNEDAEETSRTETEVDIAGSVAAQAPNVVSRLEIDWGDGSLPYIQTQRSGGNSTTTVDTTHTYTSAGEYTIELNVVDDSRPAKTLQRTAKLVINEPQRINDAFVFDQGYDDVKHSRQVEDINADGYADLIGINDRYIEVALGGPEGFDEQATSGPLGSGSTLESWLTLPPDLQFVSQGKTPRFIIDLDNDGLLDFAAVRPSTNEVLYSLQIDAEEGGGFTTPMEVWLDSDDGFSWPARGVYSVAIGDIDNNGFADFIFGRRSNREMWIFRTINEDFSVDNRLIVDSEDFNQSTEDGLDMYELLRLADLDGDGCADLMYLGEHEPTMVMRSFCNGDFEAIQEIVRLSWDDDTDVRVLSDIDNDHDIDLVNFKNNVVSVLRNESSNGVISFREELEDWSDQWGSNNNSLTNDRNPRYIADVDGDGDKDIIGYSNTSACVGISRIADLGIFTEHDGVDCYATYDTNDNEWTESSESSLAQYFPRDVGDLDNDGRTDFVGFGRKGVVYNFAPTIEQFH